MACSHEYWNVKSRKNETKFKKVTTSVSSVLRCLKASRGKRGYLVLFNVSNHKNAMAKTTPPQIKPTMIDVLSDPTNVLSFKSVFRFVLTHLNRFIRDSQWR